MFSGRIHVYFTCILYVLFVAVNDDLFHILNPIGLFIGSLLPDCDHRKAPAGRLLPLWLFGAKHRGITHTIWACILFGYLGYVMFGWQFGMSLFLGYLLHLAMDASTYMGINWFSISNKKAT